MIYSIIPYDMIFSDSPTEITYIEKDVIIYEKHNGKTQRIISTNPFDYMKDLTSADENTNTPVLL